jgi:DUF971 family protein
MNNVTSEQKTPVNIEVDMKQSQVRITWADGFKSVYPFDYLRQICPCATCNQLRQNQDPLRVLTTMQVVVKGELLPDRPVEMVGNYALQFFWADGHNSGLYGFEFLRQKSQ